MSFDIAQEYYLYKGKFKFSAEPATVELGELQLPAGEVKDDEFFGRVETYRGSCASPCRSMRPRASIASALR